MENDLISRAAAIDELKKMVEHHSVHDVFRGELLHYTGIKAMLETQPAVDAAPVVHARWEMDYSWLGHCRCSNCHGTSIEAEWLNRYMWPYCPNCGAKMDVERRECNA